MQALLDTFRRFYDFSGRSTRSEYWLFWVFCFIFDVTLALIQRLADRIPDLPAIIATISTIFTVVTFVPGLAVAVRRLHDTGRSGWWLALPHAVLLATSLIFLNLQGPVYVRHFDTIHGLPGDTAVAHLTYAARLLGPILLIIVLPSWLASLVTFRFHIQRGTPGANRFGPDRRPAPAPVEEAIDLVPAEPISVPATAPRLRKPSIYVPASRPAPPPFAAPRPAFGKRL